VFDGVDTTKISLLWPPDSIRKGERNTTVTLRTSNDPRIDMQLVKQKLSENPGLRLLTNPYVRLMNADVDQNTASGDSNSMMIALVIGGVLVCVFVVYLILSRYTKKKSSEAQPYSGLGEIRITKVTKPEPP
jgi:hypothetical protein